MMLVAALSVTCAILAGALGAALSHARRAAAALQRLSSEVRDAQEAERARLAHELHDGVGQKLAALKMHLQLEPAASAGHGTAAAQAGIAIVDGVIADVRSLSSALRPVPFDAGQLIPALRVLAQNEATRAGLGVLVDVTHDTGQPVPRPVELACYRVVREALANVVKHAGARHVAVSIKRSETALAVRVEDDGRGFEVRATRRRASVGGHLGLVGMEECASQFGGVLHVRSERGVGTIVECSLPLAVAL